MAPAIRYLERFGIPRIEFACLGVLRPRLVHRHASGAAHSNFGALPALNHISKLSAGRGRSDAILVWLRAAGPHSTIYRSRAREVTIRPQSGYIRSASLAAPAINRSGRGSCAAYIALLYERPPYSESGASLRATVCGTVAPSLIPNSEFRIPPPPPRSTYDSFSLPYH